MAIFGSSGIEAWVTENNPKYANHIIKQLKAYAKAMYFDENYDLYKAAYSSMPFTHAATNPDIKQLYIDGHFCYAYKFGIVTNGLGIVWHIDFYNREFFEKHPEIILEKKFDSPDEDKSIHDARLLIPILQDLFAAHPLINPNTFLGDAAFDSAKLYKELLSGDTFGKDADGNGIHFQKSYIPLNFRSGLENTDYSVNENRIPCCPNDPSLPMKHEETSKRKNGIVRYKFICPKVNGKRILPQENITVSATVPLPAHLDHVEEWYTFTWKRAYVLIPALYAGLRNGTIHIRLEPL